MKSALLIQIFLTGIIMTTGENGKPAAGLTGPQNLEALNGKNNDDTGGKDPSNLYGKFPDLPSCYDYDHTFVNADMKDVGKVPTHQACQFKCQITKNCINFKFNKETTICSLIFSLGAEKETDSKIISGPKYCGGQSCMLDNYNSDKPSNGGLRTTRPIEQFVKTAEICQMVCYNNEDCLSFVYEKSSGRCREISKFIGSKIAEDVASENNCQAKCMEITSCKKFEYTYPNCYVKFERDTTEISVSSDPSTIIGPKQCAGGSITEVTTKTTPIANEITDENGCPCFDPNALKTSSRIVGGEKVQFISQRPWQISLFRKGKHACGGSLIGCKKKTENIENSKDTRTTFSSSHVLTAAHCVWDKDKKQYGDATEFTAFHSSIIRGEGISVKVKNHHTKEYDPMSHMNDIAILELETPVIWTSNVRAICYKGYTTSIQNSIDVVASGWGRTIRNKNLYSSIDSLKKVQMKTRTNSDCNQELSVLGIKNKVMDGMMCAEPFDETKRDFGTFKGDSGGPLDVSQSPNNFLLGLTSFADSKRNEIPPKVIFTVFTKVSDFVDWINSIVYPISPLRKP